MGGVNATLQEESSTAEQPSADRLQHASTVRLIWSYLALALGSFGGQVLGFIGLTVVTRDIGPHNLGAYGFANTLSGYFSMPLMAGIGMVGIREIASAREGRSRTVAEVQGVLLLNGVLAYAPLFFLAPVLSSSHQTQALLRLLGLNLIISAVSLDWVMQGLQHLRLLSVLRFAGQVVYLVVLLIVMVPGGRGATIYGVCNLLGAGTTALLTIVYVLRIVRWSEVRRIRVGLARATRRVARRVKGGFAPGLGLVMVSIYFSIDIVLLGYLRGNYSVGEYTAAERIPAALGVFSGLWVTVLYPHAASLFQDNPGRLRRQIGEFATLSVLAVLPCIPVGFLLGRQILKGLFGTKFGPGGIAFGWLLCSAGLGLVNANLTQLLLACKNERAFLWSVSAGAIVNVGLNLLLIPLWGFEGSAVATVAAELSVIAVGMPKVARLIGLPQMDWKRLARAVAPLALTAALILALRAVAAWWLVLTATASAYPVLLLCTRSVTVDEVLRLFGRLSLTEAGS